MNLLKKIMLVMIVAFIVSCEKEEIFIEESPQNLEKQLEDKLGLFSELEYNGNIYTKEDVLNDSDLFDNIIQTTYFIVVKGKGVDKVKVYDSKEASKTAVNTLRSDYKEYIRSQKNIDDEDLGGLLFVNYYDQPNLEGDVLFTVTLFAAPDDDELEVAYNLPKDERNKASSASYKMLNTSIDGSIPEGQRFVVAEFGKTNLRQFTQSTRLDSRDEPIMREILKIRNQFSGTSPRGARRNNNVESLRLSLILDGDSKQEITNTIKNQATTRNNNLRREIGRDIRMLPQGSVIRAGIRRLLNLPLNSSTALAVSTSGDATIELLNRRVRIGEDIEEQRDITDRINDQIGDILQRLIEIENQPNLEARLNRRLRVLRSAQQESQQIFAEFQRQERFYTRLNRNVDSYINLFD